MPVNSDILNRLLTPHYGLTGLDPRFLPDPRFNTTSRFDPQTQSVQMMFPWAGPHSQFDAHMSYLADLDNQTIADDMWAVTLGRHTGTSPGDRATPWFMANARDIVGTADKVTPGHVKEMRQRLISQRYGEIRQTHPGPGYSPTGASRESTTIDPYEKNAPTNGK